MKERRCLFVFPGPELGGAERQGMHLARFLKRMGYAIHVWSTLPGDGRLVDECLSEGIPWESHRFLWPCRKSSLVRDGLRLIFALRRLRPDVILSYTTSPNVGCGLFWRYSNAKACIWGQRNTDDLRGDRVVRFAFERVRAVICNADHEVEYLEQILGKSNAPVHVIYNGLDLTPAEKTPTEWRKELNIHNESLSVVMLANFRPQKDHVTLLQAWTKLIQDTNPAEQPPCLVLAGAPQFTFTEVRQLAEDLKIIDTVRFPGQVHDVSGLLAACDIGVLTSRHEGLPNAVLEYMAAGLPVIATDLPGNREALGEGSDALFCLPGDPEDLSMRLKELMADPMKRTAIGERNRRRADSVFSIDAMCEKTAGIIDGLLEDGFRRISP